MTAKVFYSYSHKDETYRKELEGHLSLLRRNGHIEEWHDRRISAGDDWKEQIDMNLEGSDIILLLVSKEFLASDYCYDTETVRALERHESEEAVVIPVILKPCLWLESEFKSLQSLPRDNKPISTWDNEDQAWLEVAEGILEVVKRLAEKGEMAPKQRRQSLGATDRLILDFLRDYSEWYFSPLRIQRWGSEQPDFSELCEISTSEIRTVLEALKGRHLVKTKVSRKGNVIYKAS